MALQGTLDTFALPDVLRLLASTNKSGRLRITGDRGHGSVWVDQGRVVGAEAAAVPPRCPPADVVFDLLRYRQGSFTFEIGSMPAEPMKPIDVDDLLADAEHLLREWHEIQAVVPSMDALVELVAELPESEVVIDAPRWHTIVAVGSGTTISQLGTALELSDVTACREARDLVELGLATITDPEPVIDSAFTSMAPAEPQLQPIFGSDAAATPAPMPPMATNMPAPVPAPVPAPAPGPPPMHSSSPTPMPAPIAADDEQVDEMAFEGDEVTRQLATLSPKAARAVAAASEGDPDDERDPALATFDDDDDPINRGLLLKFLSSVKT